jgi:hypothetical protein
VLSTKKAEAFRQRLTLVGTARKRGIDLLDWLTCGARAILLPFSATDEGAISMFT